MRYPCVLSKALSLQTGIVYMMPLRKNPLKNMTYRIILQSIVSSLRESRRYCPVLPSLKEKSPATRAELLCRYCATGNLLDQLKRPVLHTAKIEDLLVARLQQDFGGSGGTLARLAVHQYSASLVGRLGDLFSRL